MTFIAFTLLTIILLTMLYVVIELSFIKDDLKYIHRFPEQTGIIAADLHTAVVRLSKHVMYITVISVAFTFIARFILLHWFHNN